VCVCGPRDAAVTCPAKRGCHSCDVERIGALRLAPLVLSSCIDIIIQREGSDPYAGKPERKRGSRKQIRLLRSGSKYASYGARGTVYIYIMHICIDIFECGAGGTVYICIIHTCIHISECGAGGYSIYIYIT